MKRLLRIGAGLAAVTLPFVPSVAAGADPAASAKASAAVPATPAKDRLALATRFARIGLDAEAVREYESLLGDTTVAEDEVLYGLAEAYRKLGRAAEAFRRYDELVRRFPASRYQPYAAFNLALAMKDPDRTRALEELAARKAAPQAVRDLARFSLAPLWASSSDAALRRKAFGTYLDLAAGTDAKLAAEAMFQAALLAYREGRYAEADTLFGRFAQQYPEDAHRAETAVYAAWSAYLAGQYETALRRAQNGGDSDDLAYLAAASLKALSRRASAAAAYAAYLKRFPTGRYAENAAYDRIVLLAAERDWAGVLKALSDHGDWSARLRGRVLALGYEAASAQQDWKTALTYARRAAACGGDKGRARYLTGYFESRLGNGTAAVAEWTRLLAETPDSPFAADALASRGDEQLQLKDFKQAYASYNELRRRFPVRTAVPETSYRHGVAARGAGDLPEAEKLLRAALAAKPDPETAREAKLELAFVLEKRGKTSEAAALLSELSDTKALERMSDATLAWAAEISGSAVAAESLERRTKDPAYRQIAATLLGDACLKGGKTAAAQAAYARALASSAHTKALARAALGLGKLEFAGRQFAAAKGHLEQAVAAAVVPEQDSLRLEAYCTLGESEEARGDEASALGYWLMAGDLFDDPERSPKALARAAAILDRQGKRDEARRLRAEAEKRYGKK